MIRLRYHECNRRFSLQVGDRSRIYNKVELSRMGVETQANRDWLECLGVKTAYIEPGSPWENGYYESFIGKLRDELLNGEIFDTLIEAKVLSERWR